MAPYHRISVLVRSTLRVLGALLWLCAAAPPPASAQDASPRWRAVIVDTFNTRIGSPDDVALVVSRAAALHVNTLLVQVRRRGDAFYLDGQEPAPEGVTIDPGFDPLAELIGRARGAGLEVHAMLTVGPVWHLATAPADPRHVFTRHGFSGGRLVEGAENWLTRTLVVDGNSASFDGYRLGTDFWLDFGHPAAASAIVALATRLVERYPVDGVHFDGLHYPEAPGGSASIGYNAVAVGRFQARVGTTSLPAAEDARWSAWRREQITGLVRRLTVSLHAARPSVTVSVAGVGTGAASDDARATVAYARTFQDWFGWLADGSVDLVVPHLYRAEHLAASSDEFAAWTARLERAPRTRPLVPAIGAYQNSLEGTLRQARNVLATAGPDGGVTFFSLAASNAPVVNNPLSSPAGRDTPQRPIEDVAAALRTGRTTGGQLLDGGQTPLFAQQVARPALSWKESIGDVLGGIEDAQGAPVDGASLLIEGAGRLVGPDDVTSDGSGVFAVPGVPAGAYRIRAISPSDTPFTGECAVDVSARSVARVTLVLDTSRTGIAACR